MSNIEEFSKFTKDDIEAARNVICKNAPDHIIRLILHRCAQLGCDPMAKMIYAVERKGVWTLQASIDLFRSTLESSPGYAGQDGPYWCGDDGVWVDVWLKKEHPRAAKVGVYRQGFAAPLYTVANWDSYAQTGAQGFMWEKFGPLMIAKCAEALCARRACPAKLSGIYSQDEMGQAENMKAVSSAPLPTALQYPPGPIDELVKSGRQLGRLSGQVQNDLQRLGGDVLALKAEYENALSQKNPRGTPAVAVAGAPKNPEVMQKVSGNELPAVDGEAGTSHYPQHIGFFEALAQKPPIDMSDCVTSEAGTYESPARSPEQNISTQKDLDFLRNAAVDAIVIPGYEAPATDLIGYNVRDNIARGIPLDDDNFPRVPPEAPASEKTKAVMQVMTHAGFEKALPQYNDKMSFCTKVAGREITAWSQLSPADCANVLARLNTEYRAEPAGELATDSEIVQLQIFMKDADFVAMLKKSRTYRESQEADQTQADSLRAARLAYAGSILKHPVSTLKEVTSEEVRTLIAACKKFKAPQNG